MIHGLAGTYSAGCRCVDCRTAATERMRRYRRGERSHWGRGRPPSPTNRVITAARRLLRAVMDDSDGWSIFTHEMNDEGQNATNDLFVALRDLDAALAPSAEPPETA